MSNALQIALATGGLFTGIVGLLVFVARLYFSGKLVPRTTLEDTITQYRERLAREKEISDSYRANNEVISATMARQLQTTEKLVDGQEVIKNFIFSLRDVRETQSTALPEGKSSL